MNSNLAYFVEKYQLKKAVERGDELHALCPFHDDEHIGNFSINLNTGLYFCFACLSRGSIIDYGKRKGLGYKEVLDLWGVVHKEKPNTIEFPASPLDKYLVDHYIGNGRSRYALSRMPENILDIYNVYSDIDNNPIFLIKDIENRYRSVWVRDENLPSVYSLLEPLSSKRDGQLFGAHLRPTDYTVVTEGFFDAMAIYQKLGQKGVCINGLWPTEAQIKALERMQPLYLMLDGDSAGRRARTVLFGRLKHLDIRVCGGYRGDPDEKTEKELQNIVYSAKNKIEWELHQTR